MQRWITLASMVCLLAGCTGYQEKSFKTEHGYEVTRIEQNPDPVRLGSMTVSKHLCESERPETDWKANESHFTGCRETMKPQVYVGEGWLVSFIKTGMISSSVWAAGHEIGDMQPSQTTINNQVRNNQKAVQQNARRH